MRATYRVLAHFISILVAVQAAFIAWAISGLGKWVSEGGVLDAAAFESEETLFPEVLGFMLHGMNGTMLIPLVALVLLIISFFTKVPGASRWAALVFLLVGVQILLGISARGGLPALGALHGINALLLFTAALVAGIRVGRYSRTSAAGASATAREPGYVA